MKDYAEIKIKTTENKLDHWESLPVYITIWGTQEYINDFLNNHFLKNNVYEIRWNWQGSSQGHYISIF